MIISIIAAMDKKGVIGFGGELPWHLPADLKNFKRITMGKPIIMGRKTWEAIGRPLPGRHNIVLTRTQSFLAQGCTVVHALSEALHAAASADEAMIIGGANIYRQTLAQAQRLYLTEVQANIAGDTYFPKFDRYEWRELSRANFQTDAQHRFAYRFLVLERI